MLHNPAVCYPKYRLSDRWQGQRHIGPAWRCGSRPAAGFRRRSQCRRARGCSLFCVATSGPGLAAGGQVILCGVLKRIHVNQHVIRANRRDGANLPPLTIKTYDANLRAHTVTIDGPSSVVYRPDRPLSCGARVWIETRAPVRAVLDGVETRLG